MASSPTTIERCCNCEKAETSPLGASTGGALKKCTGCFEAAYCSRECQQKHWKEHKGPCKRSQKAVKARFTTVEYNGMDELLAAVESGSLKFPSKATCQNCAKTLTKKSPPVCSRCKSATYCNRECQVEHWKASHKKQCQGIDTARLFTDWKRDAQRILQGTVRHVLSHEQFNQQPPTHVVRIDCGFHYNYLTFYPTKQPASGAITDLPQWDEAQSPKAIFDGLYNDEVAIRAQSSDPMARNTNIHFLMLFFEGKGSLIPVHLPLEEDSPAHILFDWETLLAVYARVGLPPQRKFGSWVVPRQTTLRQQYKVFQRPEYMPMWSSWMHHAFRLSSNEPRNMTHVLVLKFAYDFDLGRIGHLCDFSLDTLESVRAQVKQGDGAVVQDILDNTLNVHSSPLLLKSRAGRYPNSILLPLSFYEETTLERFFFPCLLDIDRRTITSRISIELSDTKAENAFCELQETVEFPEVESPEL